jgi:hypothetical protein
MDSNVSFKRMTALIIAGLFYRVVHFRINLSEQRSLGLVAAWLVIVNIFALLALNRLNLTPDTALDWMSPETYKPVQNWNIIDLHNRWDSFWYLNIATNGYQLWGENNQSNVVFFPLYPMLLAALKPFCGGNPVLAGWMVSSFFLVLSAVTLTRLTKEFHPDISDPLLPTTFMLVYPTAFYLNAVYSESLFLFFSLAAVLCTLRKNFAMGALWVALASFSFTSKFKRLLGVVSTQISIFLICAIMLIWFIPSLRFFFTVGAIALGIIAMVRLKISYGLYMLTSLGIALSSGTTLGISRYSMVLFPIYLIAGTVRSFVGRMAWWLGSTLLLALNIIRFVNHYWAG